MAVNSYTQLLEESKSKPDAWLWAQVFFEQGDKLATGRLLGPPFHKCIRPYIAFVGIIPDQKWISDLFIASL